jgi:hypothetical protein
MSLVVFWWYAKRRSSASSQPGFRLWGSDSKCSIAMARDSVTAAMYGAGNGFLHPCSQLRDLPRDDVANFFAARRIVDDLYLLVVILFRHLSTSVRLDDLRLKRLQCGLDPSP